MSLVTLGPTVVPENPFIRLHPNDNVVVARASLPEDEVISFEGGSIQVRQPIGAGHKVATREIQKGAVVYKYGVEIGVAELVACARSRSRIEAGGQHTCAVTEDS